MKKSIILLTLLMLILTGQETFGQEKIGMDGRRRNRMGLIQEGHEGKCMDQSKELSGGDELNFKKMFPRRGAMPPPPPHASYQEKSCRNCPMMGSMGCPMMQRKKAAGFCAFMFGIMLVVHILVAIWVYNDIRKRNSGSGIWIVIALLTGLFGTAVYALVRIGDSNK